MVSRLSGLSKNARSNPRYLRHFAYFVRPSARACGGYPLICRPAGVYGGGRPATRAFMRQVLTRPLWIYFPLRVIVHPTYVTDVVQALSALLDRPQVAGEIFNIGGDRALPSE